MKTLSFILILLFLNLKIFAQTVSVSVEKMNVFYIGIDNPVTIAVEGISDEKLKVAIVNGFLLKKEKGNYIVRVSQLKEVEIIVEWDDKRVVKKFRTKVIPNAKAQFKGCKGCKPEGIDIQFDNIDLDLGCKIQRYTVVYIPKNGEIKEFHIIGSNFNAELNQSIKQARKGDIFQFIEIKTICPYGHNYSIETLKYIVDN